MNEQGPNAVGGELLEPADAATQAKRYTSEALAGLAEIARNPLVRASERRKCWVHLLEIGWGKPAETVTVRAGGHDLATLTTAELEAIVREEQRLGRLAPPPRTIEGARRPDRVY